MILMKQSLILIHGGTTFDTYEEYWKSLESSELTLAKINRTDWKDYMKARLPEFEVIYPKMPNSKNARYAEWKLWFEKLFPLLTDEVVLVGHSLGGIFLAKYLSENAFPKKVISLHLVAAPYEAGVGEESLADFALTQTLAPLSSLTHSVFLYHSTDDPVVGFAHAEKYARDIPSATLRTFVDRGHFIQNEFQELLEDIRKT